MLERTHASEIHRFLPDFEIPPPEKAIGLIGSVDADVMIEAIKRAKRELVRGNS